MGYRAIRERARRLSATLVAGLAMCALVAPAPAAAWGFYAHGVTAEIALENIHPETRAKLNRLFRAERLVGTPECELSDLVDAAVWADCVRRDSARWGYTAAWHYKTAPVCEAYSARENCPGGSCVNGQIERAFEVLSREELPDNVRLEALAWLVHFVGDIHMPLHSGDKDDRGGNDRVTDYGIVPDRNLHSIWDGALAERAITSAQPPLVRSYSPAERAELADGGPADWGRESWELSRDFVYPNAFDRDPCAGELPDETALTQDDIEAAIPVSQRRVTQAGLRIARLLDAALGPEGAAQGIDTGARPTARPPE